MKSYFSNLEREAKLMLLFLIGTIITHPIVHIIIGYCVHQFVDISDLIDFPNALYIELILFVTCLILCISSYVIQYFTKGYRKIKLLINVWTIFNISIGIGISICIIIYICYPVSNWAIN